MDAITDCATPLTSPPCMHWHIITVGVGSRHFVQGETWDNIQERLICLDCGEYMAEADIGGSGGGLDDISESESPEEADYGDF